MTQQRRQQKMPIDEALAHAINDARDERKATLKDLAVATDISHETLKNYLNPKRKSGVMPITTLAAIAAALGLSPGELLDRACTIQRLGRVPERAWPQGRKAHGA